MAGRVTVATITGPYIRLYFVDAFEFSTTRLFDFGDKNHLLDIVKLIAFLTGPFKNVLQSWQPGHLPFETRIPSRPADSTHMDLKPADPQSHGSRIGDAGHSGSAESLRNDQASAQASSRRWKWDTPCEKVWSMFQTFGRRTAIWTGMTSEIPVSDHPGKEVPVSDHPAKLSFETIIKAAWLPAGLRAHEHQMFSHLHPTTILPKGCRFGKLDVSTKAQIVETIPKSIGLIEVDTMFSAKTDTIPREIQAKFGDPASALSHLELTVLAMHGPRGQAVDVHSRTVRLSILDQCEISLGASDQVWYGATKGVHFRDISPYNIVWMQVGKRKIGFLIDYGNARHLDHRRSPGPYTLYAICEDDKRSGTQDFLSTAVLITARTLPVYQGALINLETVSREDKRGLMMAEERVEKFKRTLLKSRHRYIDDLESVLYVLIFWVSWGSIDQLSRGFRSLLGVGCKHFRKVSK